MLKKFLTILSLSLLVFVVSCSDESSFKKAVGGNTYTVEGRNITFSADGSTASSSYTDEDGDTENVSFTFVSAESSTKATYSYTATMTGEAPESGTVVFTVNGSSLTIVW